MLVIALTSGAGNTCSAGSLLGVSGGSSSRSSRPRGQLRGHLAYLLVWLLAGAAVGSVALVVTRGGHGSAPQRAVRETVLLKAMRRGHCGLRGTDRPTGSHAVRVAPAIYDAPLRARERRAALSRRLVVIEYRSDLGSGRVDELDAIQRAVPARTILAPATSSTAYAMRASAYGHELRCAGASDAALDAITLFRGRFAGGRSRRG